MLYTNIIKLTNSSGETHTVRHYSSVSITKSEDDPIHSVNVTCEFLENKEIMRHHTVGSVIEIFNYPKGKPDDQKKLFEGYISSVPKVLEGPVKKISFNGKCLLGKTQRILVNETYEDQYLEEILRDLLGYTNFFKSITIPGLSNKVSFQFKDEYLYDAISKVCEVMNYKFECRFGHFIITQKENPLSPHIVKKGTFEYGTGNFTVDSDQIINHLRIYGGEEITETFKTENFISNGFTNEFYLEFKPSEISVYVDDVKRTVGIQNLHSTGFDCYMNFNEKLIQFPNNIPMGKVVRVEYKYYQTIVLEETDQNSIEKYGLFMEKKEMKSITDRSLLRTYAREVISKFKEPILTGTITPIKDLWNVGDLVEVDVEDLLIKEQVVCTQKQINLSPDQMKISLSFEKRPNIVDVLRSNIERIRELEKDKENIEHIYKFRSINETIHMNDYIVIRKKDRSNRFIIGHSKIGNVI